MTGLALLLASVVAGALWDIMGSSATFLAGAAFGVLALSGLLVIKHKTSRFLLTDPAH